MLLAFVCNEFLSSTASQLTFHGLLGLTELLEPCTLSVFFRNNHFMVLYKHDDPVGLYTLVTDQGYEKNSDIVWETLSSLEGDSTFVTGLWKPYQPVNVSPSDYIPPAEQQILPETFHSEADEYISFFKI